MRKVTLKYNIYNNISGAKLYCENYDIIQNILDAKAEAVEQAKKILEQIHTQLRIVKNMPFIEFAHFVWLFCKFNFVYSADKENQIVKSPNRMLHNSIGDCKSYSLFIYAMLKAKDYNPYFKFVCYDNSKIPSHVYIVCDGIIIDGIIDKFNFEYQHKYFKLLN